MSMHRVKLFTIKSAESYHEYGDSDVVASWIAGNTSDWYECDDTEYKKICSAVDYENNSRQQKLRRFSDAYEQLALIDDNIDNHLTIKKLLDAENLRIEEEAKDAEERARKLKKLKEKVNEKKKLREIKRLKELQEKYTTEAS